MLVAEASSARTEHFFPSSHDAPVTEIPVFEGLIFKSLKSFNSLPGRVKFLQQDRTEVHGTSRIEIMGKF